MNFTARRADFANAKSGLKQRGVEVGKKGAVLVLVFAVIAVLAVIGAAIVTRSISENQLILRQKEATQAFWLAEAGVAGALKELRNTFDTSGIGLWQTGLGEGGYKIDVAQAGAEKRRVISYGYIPYAGASARVERTIEVMVEKDMPLGFFDNAIYSGGIIDLNGSAYSINGNVLYADQIEYSQEIISGNITHDPSAGPLADINYGDLLNVSSSQNNVYIRDAQNKYINEATGVEGFPISFWYQAPTDPNDPTTGIPNVVYVKSDLVLNGNVGTIGGFLVVVGDVLTNPSSEFDAAINGNGFINGCIYTRGTFSINGGGGQGLNINGGVWAGLEAELNGSANISYNADYMRAVSAIVTAGVKITSWRDTQNPYQVAQ